MDEGQVGPMYAESRSPLSRFGAKRRCHGTPAQEIPSFIQEIMNRVSKIDCSKDNVANPPVVEM